VNLNAEEKAVLSLLAIETLRRKVKAEGVGTQKRVARELGEHPTVINRWVLGKVLPSLHNCNVLLTKYRRYVPKEILINNEYVSKLLEVTENCQQ